MRQPDDLVLLARAPTWSQLGCTCDTREPRPRPCVDIADMAPFSALRLTNDLRQRKQQLKLAAVQSILAVQAQHHKWCRAASLS